MIFNIDDIYILILMLKSDIYSLSHHSFASIITVGHRSCEFFGTKDSKLFILLNLRRDQNDNIYIEVK